MFEVRNMSTNAADELFSSDLDRPKTIDGPYIWGQTSAMRSLECVVRILAITDVPLLIAGECGTGKRTLALQIHHMSARGDALPINVCCAELTAERLSQLLRNDADGNGTSNGGTVILDEIADLNCSCQHKLLELFADGGAAAAVRLIACTARALDRNSPLGRLREELFCRLAGVQLLLPPLRYRRVDVPALAEHFLARYSVLFSRPKPTLGPEILKFLEGHSWPGNISELEDAAKIIIALGDDRMAIAALRAAGARHSKPADRTSSLSLKQAARAASQATEREIIAKALSQTHWNRKQAAQRLQISYKALLYKLKQFGLDEPATYSAGRGI